MRHSWPVFLPVLLFFSSAACADVSAPDAESAAAPADREVRTGYVLNRMGQPVRITYEVADDRAIVEGDIDIGPAWAVASTPAEAKEQASPGPRAAKLIDPFYQDVVRRWPDGIVPYRISAQLVNQQQVRDAIVHVEANAPGIDFRPATAADRDLVEFGPSTTGDCRSAVGRQGGVQMVRLVDHCGTGNTVHEIAHVMGMHHEHSRCDRDASIVVHWENIAEKHRGNFTNPCTGYTDVGPYDLASITHYGATWLARSGKKAMSSRIGSEWLMGQRGGLSKGDVSALSRMYPAMVPVHRLYSYPLRDHLYTRDPDEGVQSGYVLETRNYFYLSQATGADFATVYRCYVKSHNYLSLSSTCNAGVAARGVMGTLAIWQMDGSVPLYRTRAPTTGDRLFTTSRYERDVTLSWGWVNEGVLGYVWPQR